ncbi:MAG: hypothetical protein ACRCYB_09260 [Aeromonas veronii]
MSEYFMHGKAFFAEGGYSEISLVIKAHTASEAHSAATLKVTSALRGVSDVVFDVMTKQ